MTVYLVGAGPGDPGLLTRRGAELLAAADVVVYDRLIDPALLDLAPPGAERVDVGKRPGASRAQHAINALLVERGRTGARVVRLKGGDPYLFGRGGEEAEALRAAGVEVTVVPGVSSAFAAPAAAGVPVTHRGLSTSVTVVTGHVGEGADPDGVDWTALARAGGTIVILMGMANRAEIARRLVEGGRAADTPVAVVHWGATAAQRSVRATLATLGQVELEPPSIIVVGTVAGLDLGGWDHRPLHGWSVVLTRAEAQAEPWRAALREAGADVLSLPVIAVTEPADGAAALAAAAAAVGGYDLVAFTSVNAVERFTVYLRDARALAGVRVAAVGPATAGALARVGVRADVVAIDASAAALPAAIGRPAAAGRRALFPRAADARRELPDGLRALGWVVDEVEAYRTVAAGPADGATDDAVAAAAKADAVVFASPSAVRAFVERVGARRPPVVVCVGPVTATAAAAAGVATAMVAETPTAAGVVAALVEARRRLAPR